MGSFTGMGAWLEQQSVFRALREQAARIKAQVLQMYRDIRNGELGTKLANRAERDAQAEEKQEQIIAQSAHRIRQEQEQTAKENEQAREREAEEAKRLRERETTAEPIRAAGVCNNGCPGNTPPKSLSDILAEAIPPAPEPPAKAVQTPTIPEPSPEPATPGKEGMTPGEARAMALLSAPMPEQGQSKGISLERGQHQEKERGM